MDRRLLGRTDLHVSRAGVGGLFISRVGGDRESAIAAIRRAHELGVNFFDTAPSYYDSEEVLGEALVGLGEDVVVSTKLGGRPSPFDPRSAAELRSSVEQSLRNLQRDRIDILMIHEPDRPGQYDWWTDWGTFDGPVRQVLSDLKREGLVRWTGLGGTTTYELPRVMESGGFDVVLTAFNYSLLWREAAISVIPTAVHLRMGLVAGSPLQQGALARRFDLEVGVGAPWLSPPRRDQFRRLYALQSQCGLSLAELGLRFVAGDSRIDSVLCGARDVAEVEACITAIEAGPLDAETQSALARIAALVPFRPYEEPFSLPFSREYRGPGRAGR